MANDVAWPWPWENVPTRMRAFPSVVTSTLPNSPLDIGFVIST